MILVLVTESPQGNILTECALLRIKRVKEKIDYLLAHYVIKLSNSECVLLPKPGGSIRFCTVYRKVNAVMKGDTYPLARILDSIDYMTISSGLC